MAAAATIFMPVSVFCCDYFKGAEKEKMCVDEIAFLVFVARGKNGLKWSFFASLIV